MNRRDQIGGPFDAEFLKGGSGSGNFNHAGRPGEVGGSSSGGSAPAIVPPPHGGANLPPIQYGSKLKHGWSSVARTDPVTGHITHNLYDEKGRYTETVSDKELKRMAANAGIDRSTRSAVGRDLDKEFKNTYPASVSSAVSGVSGVLDKHGLEFANPVSIRPPLPGVTESHRLDIAWKRPEGSSIFTPGSHISNSVLVLSLHRMGTGNYEVNSYLS